jgi:hypothetical protein
MTGEEAGKILEVLVREFDSNNDGKFDYGGQFNSFVFSLKIICIIILLLFRGIH